MKKIILSLFIILFCFTIAVAEYQERELSEEEKAILKKAIEIIKKHKEKELLELMREASELKEKELSWEEKYRMYPSTKYWLDSLKEPDERYLEKLEEENDRLEDLLDDIRSERFSLEQDMMRYRWDLEDAKPRPWEYQMAAEQAIDNAIFDMMMWPDLVFPPMFKKFYYPSYLKKTDRTNYEPLLFTLCTDSKGKMDWTKYGWLKILLKNK